jgi:hypothetical protein
MPSQGEHVLTGGKQTRCQKGMLVEVAFGAGWERLGTVESCGGLSSNAEPIADYAIIRLAKGLRRSLPEAWPKSFASLLLDDASHPVLSDKDMCFAKHGATTGETVGFLTGPRSARVVFKDKTEGTFDVAEFVPRNTGLSPKYDKFADEGDSGALVFSLPSAQLATAFVVGLLIGVPENDLVGRAHVLPIEALLDELGLRIVAR